MYKVWNEVECKWINVSESWMDGVNVNNVSEFTYLSGSGKLKVDYNDGSVVYYEDIHGSWGFPTRIK